MKRAMSGIGILVSAVLLLVILVVSIMIFTDQIGRGGDTLDAAYSQLDDSDGDGTIDFFDPCPCDSGEEKPCSTSDNACLERVGE